jgi:hypothetical protein
MHENIYIKSKFDCYWHNQHTSLNILMIEREDSALTLN